MNMNHSDFFWFLAPRAVKLKDRDKSNVAIYFDVVGTFFDKAKGLVFSIRRNAMIMTAEEKALLKHGADRRLERYEDEDLEEYRQRLLAKHEVSRLAGTELGIKRGLQALGYDEAFLVRTAKYVPENWAEFFVVIDKDKLNKMGNYDSVVREVMKLKQARSMPNFSYSYKNDLDVNSSMKYGLDKSPKLGTFKLGGTRL